MTVPLFKFSIVKDVSCETWMLCKPKQQEVPMKINMTVDCTPQEARAALGLPDLEPIHQVFVEHMTEQMKHAAGQMDPNEFVKTWAPIGAQGLETFNKIFGSMASGMGGATGSTGKADDKK